MLDEMDMGKASTGNRWGLFMDYEERRGLRTNEAVDNEDESEPVQKMAQGRTGMHRHAILKHIQIYDRIRL